MTIFFTITTIISIIGWVTSYIAAKALMYYIKESGYRPPTKEEIKDCTRYAARHTLGIWD